MPRGAGPVKNIWVKQKGPRMPITAGINRHPEAASETAAPHPEEMKATLDLTIGSVLSVKAAVRTTPLAWRQRPCSLPRCYSRRLHLQRDCWKNLKAVLGPKRKSSKPPRLRCSRRMPEKSSTSLRPRPGRSHEPFSVISPDASRLIQHNTTGFGAGSAASHHGATVPGGNALRSFG